MAADTTSGDDTKRAAREARRAEIRLEKAAAAKRKAAKEAKRKARAAAMERHAAIMAAQPHPQAHWDEEREAEARRIKKLKRQLERRTSKDKSPRWSIAEKPIKLPDPIQQPDLDSEEDPAPPPRPGLIPGTYRIVDAARLRGGLLDRPRLPAQWTARRVGERLIEAHAVLRRLPMNVCPKEFGAAWPSYRYEAGELAHQAGNQTLSIGRNVIARTATADEIARMNEALPWPMQFLSGGSGAETLNWWASHTEEYEHEKAPLGLLQVIADMLNAAKEAVR